MINETSARAALDGYFYQVGVSTWIALDLMLARRLADAITLEPTSEEDLEAFIDQEADAGVTRVTASGYQLVVQCKHRTTGPFGASDVKRLLSHGTRRQKPRDRLMDFKNRYLLVSDADLQGVARNLGVRQVGEWPASIPSSIRRSLPATSNGRLAILHRVDRETLGNRIAELLLRRFRLPRDQLEPCRQRLESEALARMRGQANGVWTRPEVEQIVTEHGGYLGVSEALEGYVRPTNWQDLTDALEQRHAVVIVGASGTGKTRTAKALVAAMRETIPGIRHVYVDGGPEKVTTDPGNGDVVFEIEDPWGKYRLAPSAQPWRDAISPVLDSAGPGRKFVVTSRSDILIEASARLPARWIVQLEEENYGNAERGALFDRRFDRTPREVQQALLGYRKHAVDRLATPLEMERFFSNLQNGRQRDENDATFVERCLTEAHHTSIETALLNGVEDNEAWDVATVTWGLFQMQPRLSFDVVPALQAGLARRVQELEDKLLPFIHFLIAGRNLRQVESTIAVQHPRVEQGLETAMMRRPNQASRILTALIETLLAIDDREGTDWGVEGAARILAAASGHAALDIELKADAQSRVDQWLDDRVVQRLESSFLDDIDLAAAAGSRASDVAELARWLTHRREGANWFELIDWTPPERSSEWIQRIVASAATMPILDAWVRRAMPSRHRRFPEDFWEHARRLSGDLAAAFINAAVSIAGSGYHDNDDAIAEGAIQDLAGYEEVVTAAVEHEAGLDRRFDAEFSLQLKNGEFDEPAVEHYSESAGEDTITSGNLLKRYVEEKRERGRWIELRDHPRRDGLAWAWMHVASRAKDASDEEWLAIADAMHSTNYPASFWREVRDAPPPVLGPVLRTRLHACADPADMRRSMLLAGLRGHVDTLRELVGYLATSEPAKFLALAVDLKDALEEAPDDKAALQEVAEQLLIDLGPEDADDFRFLGGLSAPLVRPPRLTARLEAATAVTPQLEIVRVELFAGSGAVSEETLLGLLRRTGDNSDVELALIERVVAIAAAGSHRRVLEEALTHRFADVRRDALVALAELAPGRALPPELLAMAKDKGNRVRSRVLALLQDRPAPEHVETLLHLTEDTYTASQQYYGQEADYPIAQEAADLLNEQLGSIDEGLAQRLWEIARKSEDVDVKLRLLRIIARHGDEGLQSRLLARAAGSGNPPYHRLAARALFLEADHVPTSVMDMVPDEALNLRSAESAAFLCLALGKAGSLERVRAAARGLANNPDRRGLVLLLAWGALSRGLPLATELLRLLPSEQAGRAIVALSGGAKFQQEDVDALADVRVAALIKRLMKALIIKPESPGSEVSLS